MENLKLTKAEIKKMENLKLTKAEIKKRVKNVESLSINEWSTKYPNYVRITNYC